MCKITSDEYPPRTLYQMALCIQMHLEMYKVYWKLLGKGDNCLQVLYYMLDNIIKQCTMDGLGRKVSVSILTEDAEETMWSQGILGEDSLCQLSDTMLYLLGLNLALCGGEEQGYRGQVSTCNCLWVKIVMVCNA